MATKTRPAPAKPAAPDPSVGEDTAAQLRMLLDARRLACNGRTDCGLDGAGRPA